MAPRTKTTTPRTGKTHLYEALSAKIEASIRKKGLKPHAPFLSHREVEKAYGSNNITVAKAMKDLVERGILYAVPYKGCFVSPVVRNRKILCISDSAVLGGREVDFVDFMFTAGRLTEESNGPFEMVPMSAGTFRGVHGEIRQRIPDLAGVLVFRDPSSLAHLGDVSTELPVVFFGARSRMPVLEKSPWASRVLFDEGEIAAVAHDHLRALGHRRVGVLDVGDFVVHNAVAEGFRALGPQVAGFTWGRNADGQLDPAREEDLVAWARKLTAVFCTSDRTAVAFLQVLISHGIRIPRDLAVVSLNDTPVCEDMRPGLSSIRLISPVGVKACLDLIARGPGDMKEVRVPMSLVVRGSSGSKLP